MDKTAREIGRRLREGRTVVIRPVHDGGMVEVALPPEAAGETYKFDDENYLGCCGIDVFEKCARELVSWGDPFNLAIKARAR